MANYAWRLSHAVCPHYLKSWDRSITCGTDEANIRRKFSTDKGCAEHYKRFCSRNYTKCQHLPLVIKVEE